MHPSLARPRSPRHRAAALIMLLAVAATAASAGAQTVDSTLRGRILSHLIAKRDTSYRYAAYIPRGYQGTHAVPLLLVLDPQGRADEALARTAAAAERLGWIAMSSYDTRGDAPAAANQNIVNVMLSDAFTAFDLDTARIYVAGLSGTANDAWIFAYGALGHIAGILSADAALPADSAWRRAHTGVPPFDVAMTAGRRSFGYDEVFTAAEDLLADSAFHRMDTFSTGTDWPPEPVMAQTLGWLEARAMARHLRTFDRAFVDSVFAIDSAAAAALEAGGQPARAADRWQNIAAAWAGTHDVAFANARVGALTAEPAVTRWRAERDSLLAVTPAARTAIVATLVALRQRPGVPDLRRLTSELRIAQFQTWAADSADSLRAEWAVRRLAEVYTRTSYYEPEAYMAVSDDARALAVLAIAAEIEPTSPQVCRERARAYALRRESGRTLTELRCALAGHTITLNEIRADPRYKFMALRDDFLKLIAKPGGGN